MFQGFTKKNYTKKICRNTEITAFLMVYRHICVQISWVGKNECFLTHDYCVSPSRRSELMHVGMVLLAEISPIIVLSPNLEKKQKQTNTHCSFLAGISGSWVRAAGCSASSHISAIMSPLSCVGVSQQKSKFLCLKSCHDLPRKSRGEGNVL